MTTAPAQSVQTELIERDEPEADAPEDGTLEPGIYPDMSDETYYSADAIGSTEIRDALEAETPRELAAERASDDDKDSDGITTGQAVDLAVLQPGKFLEKANVPQPPVDWSGMYYRHREAAEQMYEGKSVDEMHDEGTPDVSKSKIREYTERDDVRAMLDYWREYGRDAPPFDTETIKTARRCRESVFGEDLCRELLHGVQTEVAVFGDYGRDVERFCRGRLDALDRDREYIVELKTVDGNNIQAKPDAYEQDGFGRRIDRMNYHVQAGLYTMLSTRYGDVPPSAEWWWIVVETSGDYDATAMQAPEDLLAEGAQRACDGIETIDECDRGSRQGYESGQTVDIPDYAYKYE